MSDSIPVSAKKAGEYLAGATKHLTNGASMMITGKPYTAPQIDAVLGPLVTTANAVASDKLALASSLVAARAALADAEQFLSDMGNAIVTQFGNDPATLADFGKTPKKARKAPSALKQVIAEEKGRSTRAARGTTGKNAKAAIKGAAPTTLVIEAPPTNAPAITTVATGAPAGSPKPTT